MEKILDWEKKFWEEISAAEIARQSGNEGKARVCARRAAGLAAAEYLLLRGIAPKSPSAYDYLRRLENLSDNPEGTAEIVERMLMRVTTEFSLPVEADLIEDARQLKRILLPNG